MLKTHTGKLEVKKLTEKGEFEGYGSVFDIEDQGADIVLPGAFAATLRTKTPAGVKMLWQHDPSSPIGVWTEMKEDTKGLYVKGNILSEVSKGAEALALMRAGVIDGLSIGFRTVTSELDHETYTRKIKEVDLWEVSVVTFPMNTQARVDKVKNATPRDVERTLRDAGYSANFAKAVATHGAVKATELMGKQRDAAVQADLNFVRNLFS